MLLNKKNVSFFTFLIFFFSIHLCGQDTNNNYESFNFYNYSPRWKHVIMDTSIIGQYQISGKSIIYDGWSNYFMWHHGKGIVVRDNDLFLVATLLKNGFEGIYIEDLDLDNGNVKWQQSVDFRNNDRKEWPFYSYINSNGELEVIGARQLYNEVPQLPDPLWLRATLFVRKFNSSTGVLNEFNYGDEDDSSTKIIHSFFNAGVGSSNYLSPYEENKYRFFDQGFLPDDYQMRYRLSIMDNNGRTIKDSVVLDHIDYIPYVAKTISVSNDTILSFIYSYKDEATRLDSFEVKINILDKDLNKINELDLSDKLAPLSKCQVLYADHKDIILIGDYKEKINSKNNTGYFYCNVDYQGNIKEMIFHKDENGFPVNFPSIGTKLKYEDGIFIVSRIQSQDKHWGLNFYKSDGNGNLILKKSLKIDLKNHKPTPYYVSQMNKGDILLGCEDRNTDLSSEVNPANVFMLIPGKDLDIKTSTNEKIREKKEISIFPNPTKNVLNLVFPSYFSGKIILYNNVGDLIKTKNIENLKEINLDVSSLSPGVYFVEPIGTEGEIKFGTNTFVKE